MRNLQLTRRDVLKSAAALVAGRCAFSRATCRAQGATTTANRRLQVRDIRRTTVKVPYRPVPERNMDRELPHWRYSEIVEVELQTGHVGFGETLLYYTWGRTGDADVARVQGRHALEMMWDDSLGAGLQMALFDAVAKAAEVPLHALLGPRVHDRTPLSWWNIDTSPEDMAAECKLAFEEGYLAYKTKGRPWFDVWEQVAASARVVPETFKIDMDFNDTLLDAERAIPILKDLEQEPRVGIYETPIFQSDIEGNQLIREATRVPIAMHYGTPEPAIVVRQGMCDGLIIGGGATRLLEQGAFAGEAGLPFWLQLVGTGITAAWSLHFGAVLRQAVWPAVNCHQLYTHSLLTQPIAVKEGYAEIPSGPGLGFDLDRDAVEKFRVPKPASRPEPERLLESVWPDGRRMYVASPGRVNFMLDAARDGQMPFYERGVTTRLVPNDGSERWRELYIRSRTGPYLERQ